VNVVDKEFVMGAINFRHTNVFTLVAEHRWYNRESDCGQFGTVHLKFKLSMYIQETVGDR